MASDSGLAAVGLASGRAGKTGFGRRMTMSKLMPSVRSSMKLTLVQVPSAWGTCSPKMWPAVSWLQTTRRYERMHKNVNQALVSGRCACL